MFQLTEVKYKDILEVEALKLGEEKLTAISGPSGGGKTTLLRLLINLISPEQGEIFYRGKNLEQYPPLQLRQEVKMLAQNPVMFGKTIREDFQQAADLAGFDGHSLDDYKNIVEKMRLHKNLEDSTEELSGGEKQRVALARLLLLRPEVLLLDEPTASLDTANEEYLLDFLKQYAEEEDLKIIMVTHAPELAAGTADRQIIIAGGKVKEADYSYERSS